MPKMHITLQDSVNDQGQPICRVSFKLDREGYPLDAPPTPALMHAAAIRTLGDLGVIDRLMPLIEVKIQFDELTGYLKSVGALDDAGNLRISPVRPDVEDLTVIDGTAVPVTT